MGIVFIFILLTLHRYHVGCQTVDDVMEVMLKRMLQLEEKVQIMEKKADEKKQGNSNDDCSKAIKEGVEKIMTEMKNSHNHLCEQNQGILKKLQSTDRTVDDIKDAQGKLLKSQGETLRNQGETLKSQGMMLNTQGEALKRQSVTLMKLDGDLRDQKIILKNQGLTLSKQEADLNRQGDTLKKLQDDLTDQGTTLKSQDKTLCQQRETLEKQSSSLKGIEGDLKDQTLVLKSQNTTLSEHREILRKQEETLKSQGMMLNTQGEALKRQGVTLIKLDGDLRDQKIIMKNQGLTLSKQEADLNRQGDTLKKLQDDLMDQGTTLKSQDKTLCQQRETLEKQSSSLKGIKEELNRQGFLLKSQNTTLSEQRAILNDQSKNTKTQGVMLKNQTILLQKQDVILHQQAETLLNLNRTMGTLESSVNKNFKDITQIVTTVKVVLTAVPPGKTHSDPADSCTWLNTHHYNLKSGKYWLNKGGRISFEYCKMDDAGVPLLGSCKELKERNPELKSGIHKITVAWKNFEVFCDMETDGGGWTMVGKAVVNKESEAKGVDYRTIQRDDFHQLHKVTTGRFLLSTKGLNSLYNIHKFTELRFQCFKPYHGRHLDLKTNGSFVLEWLLERGSELPKPPSCGTFTPLHNDRSFIGQHCEKWGEGKWNWRSIYDDPMFAFDDGRRGYTVSLYYNWNNQLFCDDYDHPNFNNKGIWSFYIR